MEKNDYVEMVEKFFTDTGGVAKDWLLESTEKLKVWQIYRGSSFTVINLDFDSNSLRVISPIIFLPQQNILALYRLCLEMNFSLTNCALYAYNDTIGIVHQRSLNGLDYEEFREIIDYLTYVSDDLDDKFKEEFGATMYTEEVNS